MKVTKNMKQTSVRLPVADLNIIDNIAEDEGLDRVDIIRRAIKEYLSTTKQKLLIK